MRYDSYFHRELQFHQFRRGFHLLPFVKKAAAVAVEKGVALRDDEPYSIS
jgi:hypothetical protein